LLAPCSVHAARDAAFDDALAELKRQRAETAVLGVNKDQLVAMNEGFLKRLTLESLGPREFAEVVRIDPFRYGELAPTKAKAVVDLLKVPAQAPDEDGALTATLIAIVAPQAGMKGEERAQVAAAAINHPAYLALLNGEYGDLALNAACRAGMRDETHRDFVMSLAGKLDATTSTAAADSVASYWSKIEQAFPEGPQRQTLRQQLADYLAAVLRQDSRALSAERRVKIENLFARLTSAAARGEQLAGKPAPELHFLWSSEGDWKTLSDLRGKVVVLDFWATWCGPCVASFPKVAQLAERYRGTNVVVIGVTSLQGAMHGLGSKAIDCRGDPEKEMRLMADFIQANNITWPIVFSRENVFNPAYGIEGIPHMVIVAPDGSVRHQFTGFPKVDLTALIDALLVESK
jgi:thiol-disulfide isomerase/thioredoxin